MIEVWIGVVVLCGLVGALLGVVLRPDSSACSDDKTGPWPVDILLDALEDQ